MEIQYTNTKRPKLTVSTKRFTVKLNKDLHNEEELKPVLELFQNIKNTFDKMELTETYRGIYNEETQSIVLRDNSLINSISFSISFNTLFTNNSIN